MLHYKNYHGHFNYDPEAEIFHGRVIGIRDVVTFQGTSVQELKQSFQDSVDDYLDFCSEQGDEPDKPFSGKFLLRLDPELHRTLDLMAAMNETSLNGLITEILKSSAEKMIKEIPGLRPASDLKADTKFVKKTKTKKTR